MGLFNLFKKPSGGSEPSIRVEFINAADNSTIAVSEMPVSRLPDTFAIDTTLDIKNQKWSVQSADPIEKAHFLKTGKLRLLLSRITVGVPGDILFSLPTISDDVGQAWGNTSPNDAVFAIHEDNWRQIEFVSAAFDAEIEQEFADIRQIWTSEKREVGFKNLHVRKRIPEPLTGSSVRLDDLKAIVTAQRQFEGVGFLRTPGIIPSSFAWSTDAQLVVWGIAEPEGRIVRLCLAGMPQRDSIVSVSASLAAFTQRQKLYLVNWCRMAKISTDAKLFEHYFSREG